MKFSSDDFLFLKARTKAPQQITICVRTKLNQASLLSLLCLSKIRLSIGWFGVRPKSLSDSLQSMRTFRLGLEHPRVELKLTLKLKFGLGRSTVLVSHRSMTRQFVKYGPPTAKTFLTGTFRWRKAIGGKPNADLDLLLVMKTSTIQDGQEVSQISLARLIVPSLVGINNCVSPTSYVPRSTFTWIGMFELSRRKRQTKWISRVRYCLKIQ